MTLIVSPDLSTLFVKLRALIAMIVPTGTRIIKGPINRTAQPKDPHVIMTPLFFKRLRTNVDSYDDGAPESLPSEKLAEMGVEQHVQVDFYGSPSSGWATIFATVFRDEYAADALAPTCAPLYSDEARMIPLVTGEEQYLERWAVTAAVQYNPTVSTPQQFADAATVVLVEVDTEFPPT